MSAECTLGECLDFFDDVLVTLRRGFEAIENIAPKPEFRIRSDNADLRYREPTLELALFLKLARNISLLGGLRTMVERGMVQEQGILKRAIDETDQDITFLSFGQQNGLEEIHEAFLEAFWAEEFEDANKPLSHKRRESVPRRKIQAYNNRATGLPDPSTSQSIDRMLQGLFSGYVHGASTHILDLFDVPTGRFCLDGLPSGTVHDSYVVDSANYPYRVLMSAVMVARALGLEAVAEGFHSKMKATERFVGLPSDEEAAELLDRLRSK